jgi:hypothetical protein
MEVIPDAVDFFSQRWGLGRKLQKPTSKLQINTKHQTPTR